MTRLYNIDGWHTYQDLHDRLGYTMQPSAEVSYVLSSDSNWGNDAGNHGYFSGLPDTDDQYDPSDGEYFEVDVYGWSSLDELLSDVGLMPSNADTSILMQKGSTISKAAVIAPPRLDPIYCVSAELESGWHTYDWWEDNGWEEAQPSSSLLFGGDFSGNDITIDSVDGGGSVINRYNPGRALFPNTGWVDGTMISKYNPGRSLFELLGWEPGGYWSDGISIYYLTPQGAASTTDFGLGSNSIYDLYDASGHTVVDQWNNHSIISANRINPVFPEEWTQTELESLSIVVASPYYGNILQLKTGTVPYYNSIFFITVKPS